MSIEKSSGSINKHRRALFMLPLTLPAFGRVNVKGLGRQAIQLALALTLSMFSGNAMANNREQHQIALVGTGPIFRMRRPCRSRYAAVKGSIVWRLMATAR